MKKCLLLFFLLAGIQHVFASTTQGNWRWRRDDGSETSANWIAAENTSPTINTYDKIRVRIERYNEDDSDTYDLNNLKLQYSFSGAENSWTDITTDSLTHDFVLATSAFVADGAPTIRTVVGPHQLYICCRACYFVGSRF